MFKELWSASWLAELLYILKYYIIIKLSFCVFFWFGNNFEEFIDHSGKINIIYFLWNTVLLKTKLWLVVPKRLLSCGRRYFLTWDQDRSLSSWEYILVINHSRKKTNDLLLVCQIIGNFAFGKEEGSDCRNSSCRSAVKVQCCLLL